MKKYFVGKKNENRMEQKGTDKNEIKFSDNRKDAEWLRSFKGCEHYTDDEAVKIVQSLERLANILFDFTCEQNGILIDNQLVITSNSENNELKNAA